ncbi:MAG TPA: sodium:proton exchanger, partial [Saprospiraceae bacterium]|nr:sodium:proton exchanger [Saprospiraceae bacterium]
MDIIFYSGIILFAGFIFGELVTLIKLPKVTGYILAGVLLNPELIDFIPKEITVHTDFITDVSLSFITFSVGGTLLYSKIKQLGKSILLITFFEAELAFIFTLIGIFLLAPFLIHITSASIFTVYLPLALFFAALASPTDPSSTLAVMHQYKAKGKVSSTIMGVAAFDDIFGLLNFSIALSIAQVIVSGKGFEFGSSILSPLYKIFGALALGAIMGFVLNKLSIYVKKETAGNLVVVIFGVLLTTFGLAHYIGVDELLATMAVGIIVVNFNPYQERIFDILSENTEELIFVLFFTLSGLQLDFNVLFDYLPLAFVFVALRFGGKYFGTKLG